MTRLESLTFEQFQAMLADLLQIDRSRLTPDAYLITELGVDSLRLLQLWLQFEEIGVTLNLDRVWEVQTVGDAYRYYQAQAGA